MERFCLLQSAVEFDCPLMLFGSDISGSEVCLCLECSVSCKSNLLRKELLSFALGFSHVVGAIEEGEV